MRVPAGMRTRRRTSGQRRTRSAHAGLGTGRHACQRAAEHTTPSGYGPRRDAFVTTLYHDILGQLPESSGEKFLISPPGPRRQPHTGSGPLDLAFLRTPPARRPARSRSAFRRAYHERHEGEQGCESLKKADLPAGPLALERHHR